MLITLHPWLYIVLDDRGMNLAAGRIEAIGTEEELRRSNPIFLRLHEIHYQRESA